MRDDIDELAGDFRGRNGSAQYSSRQGVPLSGGGHQKVGSVAQRQPFIHTPDNWLAR